VSKTYRAKRGRTLQVRFLGDSNVYDKPDLGGAGEKVTQSRKSLLRLLQKRVTVDGLALPLVVTTGEVPEINPNDPLAEALRGARLSGAERDVWEAEHVKRLAAKGEVARVAEAQASSLKSEAMAAAETAKKTRAKAEAV
jgi:hypothetical protein